MTVTTTTRTTTTIIILVSKSVSWFRYNMDIYLISLDIFNIL
uniref:Uncharacterized protein n=1 Tax=Rhizophora mucronata TaxID=61149 RepID=A0A2P2NIE7_RHIMU